MAKAESASEDKPEGLRLRARLRYLYHGSTPAAVKFRLAIIVIDLFIIGFFLAGPILKNAGWVFYVADYAIAAFLAIDLIARAMAYTDARDWLKRPVVWADLFVLATFHMLSIQVYVRAIVDREFHLAVGRLGPTEMRLGIVLMNLGILQFGAPPLPGLPISMSWCDVLMLATGIGLLALYANQMRRHLARLAKEDPPRL